jgi:cyclohexyl-isocyanide hydratase
MHARTAPIHVAFLLFPGVTQLDLTGPAQVLSRLGNAKVDLVAKTREPVADRCRFRAAADRDLCRRPAHRHPLRPRRLRHGAGDGGCRDARLDPASGRGASWITSVCTGSLLLGAAGLLKGYRATCHWASRDQLAWFGAEPVAERVVFDRNRVTGGGVTAGIDFALALVAAIRGEAHARFVQLSLEYDPAPPFDSRLARARRCRDASRCYQAMVDKFSPGRADKVRAIAEAIQ